MPVPTYQAIMRPLLSFAEDGTEKSVQEAVASELALTDPRPSGLPSLPT